WNTPHGLSPTAAMTSSSSLSPAVPARVLHPAWCLSLGSGLRGLALAREKGMLLVWDERGGLYLLNRRGERQAHRPLPGAAADAAAGAAGGGRGEVWWLAPDLAPHWQATVAHPAVAAALDPFGQYLAVADGRGRLHVLDRHARRVMSADSPRPLHHLAFVP